MAKGSAFALVKVIGLESSELSFFSTQEFIAELASRQTFLGVVLHSASEWKGEHWGDERTFKVLFNDNLSAEEASRLLSRVSDYIDFNYC